MDLVRLYDRAGEPTMNDSHREQLAVSNRRARPFIARETPGRLSLTTAQAFLNQSPAGPFIVTAYRVPGTQGTNANTHVWELTVFTASPSKPGRRAALSVPFAKVPAVMDSELERLEFYRVTPWSQLTYGFECEANPICPQGTNQ